MFTVLKWAGDSSLKFANEFVQEAGESTRKFVASNVVQEAGESTWKFTSNFVKEVGESTRKLASDVVKDAGESTRKFTSEYVQGAGESSLKQASSSTQWAGSSVEYYWGRSNSNSSGAAVAVPEEPVEEPVAMVIKHKEMPAGAPDLRALRLFFSAQWPPVCYLTTLSRFHKSWE